MAEKLNTEWGIIKKKVMIHTMQKFYYSQIMRYKYFKCNWIFCNTHTHGSLLNHRMSQYSDLKKVHLKINSERKFMLADHLKLDK